MDFEDKKTDIEETEKVANDTTADITENNSSLFYEDDEAMAVTDMVKAIAGGTKQPQKAVYAGSSSLNVDDEDEEEWSIVKKEKTDRSIKSKDKKAEKNEIKLVFDKLFDKFTKKNVNKPASSSNYAPLHDKLPEADDFFDGSKDLTELIDEVYASENSVRNTEDRNKNISEEEVKVAVSATEIETVTAEEATEKDTGDNVSYEAVSDEEASVEQEEKVVKLLSLENEMRMAVEDVMFTDETSEAREARHESYYETDDEIPVIDMSDIGLFDENFDSEIAASDDIINELGLSLAEQVSDELDKGKRKIIKFSVLGVVSFLLLFILFVLFTKPGHVLATKAIAHFVMSKIEVDVPDQNQRAREEDVLNPDKGNEFVFATFTPTPEILPDDVTPTPVIVEDYHPHFEKDDSVVNILLCGIENQFGDQTYGRSDTMMVASFSKEGGPVKLVSLMRDMFVEIPGHNDSKLNSAYAWGGPKLLMETIELNFGLHIDGYVTINFEGFKSLVDYVGGVEISLTEQEAEYLRTTNYIADKTQRKVVAGKQVMNGEQALGYCRIRKIPTANQLGTDFGRTYRQRVVLQKIFDKYKTANITTLYGAMNDCLKYVKCSSSMETIIQQGLQTFVEKGITSMETFRIPASGYYIEESINDLQVLSISEDNAYILHDFLYPAKDDGTGN